MRYLRYISVLALSLTLVSCGGGGGGSGAGSTTVWINLGRASVISGVVSSGAIPSSVSSVRFYISGSGMAPVERTISVAAGGTVAERFDIPNGENRHFQVFSYNSSGDMIYYGDAYADMNGVPVAVTITMVANEIPPVFAGAAGATAVSSTEIDLSWTAADDDITQPSDMVYLIYISTTPGGENLLTEPDFVTAAGAVSYRVTGLLASTTYYFVVRAKDEAGNVDNNTAEVSATTQTPADTTPPTFSGAAGATAVSSAEIDLTWNAATDNVTASSNIVYLIYLSTTSGGQDFQTPNYVTAPGATAYAVTGLESSTTYYFVVRAKDEAGNVEQNTVEVSATTQSLFSMH